MKKRLFSLCVAVCLLAMTACKKESTPVNVENNQPEATVTEAATATKEPTAEPTQEPTTEAATPEASAEDANASDKEGIITGTTYSNGYYNFEITLPDTWTVFDHDTTLSTMYASMGAIYDNVEDMKASYEQLGIDYLFYGMDSVVSTDGTNNALCQVIPSSMIGGLSLTDFIKQTAASSEQQYQQLGGVVESSEPETITIDGREAVSMELSTVVNGTVSGVELTDMHIKQKYIMTEENGIILVFLTTVYNEESKTYADDILSTIHFLK
ncbi:MAG: hypothetical protein E7256_03410 [Lachnospiraceae bacterium]|nr:hypothetical protein [Lachnospiraceae bacterium]